MTWDLTFFASLFDTSSCGLCFVMAIHIHVYINIQILGDKSVK